VRKLLLVLVFILALFGTAEAQSVLHNLTWTDNNTGATNETKTTIEQKVGTGTYAVVGSVATDIIKFTITVQNPPPGNRVICYRLQAFSSTGLASAYSNEACATTPPVVVVIAPSGVQVQQVIAP
jgi:hypothetical protein